MKDEPHVSAIETINEFYRIREHGDPDLLRNFIAQDVVWCEPTVGNHMGELVGVDAVVDMITRALVTTGGSFSLKVAQGVEVHGHCAAIIEWTAEKNGNLLKGRELASFSIKEGKITFAQFLPENISNDQAFWGEDD